MLAVNRLPAGFGTVEGVAALLKRPDPELLLAVGWEDGVFENRPPVF